MNFHLMCDNYSRNYFVVKAEVVSALMRLKKYINTPKEGIQSDINDGYLLLNSVHELTVSKVHYISELLDHCKLTEKDNDDRLEIKEALHKISKSIQTSKYRKNDVYSYHTHWSQDCEFKNVLSDSVYKLLTDINQVNIKEVLNHISLDNIYKDMMVALSNKSLTQDANTGEFICCIDDCTTDITSNDKLSIEDIDFMYNHISCFCTDNQVLKEMINKFTEVINEALSLTQKLVHKVSCDVKEHEIVDEKLSFDVYELAYYNYMAINMFIDLFNIKLSRVICLENERYNKYKMILTDLM